VKIKTTLIAALLAPSFATAQYQDRSTGQQFDAYGRPLPSAEELCREGQMAGGPITPQCGMYDYRFNRKGERLARYDFTKWGYNVLDNGVTESDAARLDSDPAFRAKYIKSHGYDKHPLRASTAHSGSSYPSDLEGPNYTAFLNHVTSHAFLDDKDVMLTDLKCKGHPGYVARMEYDNGFDAVSGCSDSLTGDTEFTVTWDDGGHGVYEPDKFVPTELGVKYRVKASARK
jgi:hypothetical protein